MTVQHVILDRDGVLNVEATGGWVLRVQDWRWQEAALEALAILSPGRTLSVATNQSCIGRGLVDAAVIEAVHTRMCAEAAAGGAPFAGVHCCAHSPEEGCRCRKPEPGLLLQAVGASGIPPEHTVFVGDSEGDLQAARRAEVTPVLVRTGKGRDTESSSAATGVAVFDDLLSFAHFLRRGGTLSPSAGRVGTQ